jgi:hypothetical protein
VKPDLKLPAKSVGDTLAGTSGGRDSFATVREISVDLKLEGLDATQIYDLGGVTDDIMAAQMEILARNEVSDSGEETVGDDSEDDGSFSGRGNHDPAAPEFKDGARIVYLGQEGDKVIIGYVLMVHRDGKGCPPSTPRIWKDLEKNRLKDIGSLLWRLKMNSPPCVRHSTIPLFFQDLPSPKGQKG